MRTAQRPRARCGRARYLVTAFSKRDTGDLVVAAYPVDETAWLADNPFAWAGTPS